MPAFGLTAVYGRLPLRLGTSCSLRLVCPNGAMLEEAAGPARSPGLDGFQLMTDHEALDLLPKSRSLDMVHHRCQSLHMRL